MSTNLALFTSFSAASFLFLACACATRGFSRESNDVSPIRSSLHWYLLTAFLFALMHIARMNPRDFCFQAAGFSFDKMKNLFIIHQYMFLPDDWMSVSRSTKLHALITVFFCISFIFYYENLSKFSPVSQLLWLFDDFRGCSVI